MKLLDHISEVVKSQQVSDLILKEGDPLWCRKNGTLTADKAVAVTRDDLMEFIRKNEAHSGVLAAKINQILEASGDVDLAVRVGNRRFRANIYWSNGKKLTMALRRLSDKSPALLSLGLPHSYVQTLVGATKGLLLVTGATGSGKTTTLASSLEYLNEHRSGHIITLEDPVEYVITSNKCLVDQRQIGRDVKNFNVGLRAALRQDPDILLVGELRDFDTVKTAIDAANTGHLVLGTLHTNSAQQSVERLTSFFSSEKREWAHAVLSQVVLGIVSQTLVPRMDGTGRVLAAEVMVATGDVRNCIRNGNTHQLFNAMDTGSQKGQVLMNKVLKQYVKNGTISVDDAMLATYDQPALLKELKS